MVLPGRVPAPRGHRVGVAQASAGVERDQPPSRLRGDAVGDSVTWPQLGRNDGFVLGVAFSDFGATARSTSDRRVCGPFMGL